MRFLCICSVVWLERSLYQDHLLGVGIPAVIDLYISGKKVKKLALFTIISRWQCQ